MIEQARKATRTARPLRVLHVVPALFGDQGGVFGGAERYALELARHMADVAPTRLVTFGRTSERTTLGRLQIHVLGRPWHVRGQAANPLAPGLIPHLARADVIHCHQQHVLASSVCALLGRLAQRRLFVTDLGGGGWDLSAYVRTDRWYHGHLHLSEYSRRVAGHDGCPWAHVIWGGVDTARFSPDNAVMRSNTVLFVGRLLPHKGVGNLIAAIPNHVPLELIGQPYDRGHLAQLHVQAVGKRVSFRHDCDDDALVNSYRQACCVVLPSVHRTSDGQETRVPELLGQTLLEGMACGTPTVATRVASLPEVVMDGVTGLLVPPNDPLALRRAILWLLEHPAEAARMGAAARQQVLERFTWPAVVRRCLSLYGMETARS